jgi:hypothetical protein
VSNYGTESFNGSDYTPFGTTNVAIKARGGRLARVVITSAVTGNLTIYDNPSAASGTILFQATAPTAPNSFLVDLPAKTGIYAVPGSAGGGIISFS